jgi:hypothetical protein
MLTIAIAALALNLPPLSDADCLPTPEFIQIAIRASNGHADYLDGQARIMLHHADLFRAHAAIARRTNDAYWLMAAARRSTSTTAERRRALAHLRDLIGPEAYYTQTWPPPIPLP